MGLLNSPTAVAEAIGATCQGKTPSAVDPKFLAMLRDVQARIEDVMNVYSLARGRYTDSFKLAMRYSQEEAFFRLSAGYVVDGTLVVTDPFGVPVPTSQLDVDLEKGIVAVAIPINGRYVVQYDAGFAEGTDEYKTFVGVPDWLKAVVDAAAVLWFRTTQMKIIVPDNVSYRSVIEPLHQEVGSRIYGRYQRPRVGMTFPSLARREEIPPPAPAPAPAPDPTPTPAP